MTNRVRSGVRGMAARSLAALCLGVVVASAPGLCSPAPGAAAAAARVAVADWTLRTTDGREVSLHGALARGPVLVSFWALWCAPCLRELPHLDAIAKEHAGRLTVLAINEDGPRGVARVRPYLASKSLHLTVPLDTGGDVSRQMQVGGTLPFLVLFDAQGREVHRTVGYREGGEVELRARIAALLAATSADSAATP